jgi:predicted MFS family arabinose efflux permease
VWLGAAGLTAVFATWPLGWASPSGVVLAWAVAAWAVVPAQQHLLVGRAPATAPMVLALNSSAVNLGFALGALGGGLVAVDRLWVFAAGFCGLGLAVQTVLVGRPLSTRAPETSDSPAAA